MPTVRLDDAILLLLRFCKEMRVDRLKKRDIQKALHFVSRFTNIDADFETYLDSPYSREVEGMLGDLVMFGLVIETEAQEYEISDSVAAYIDTDKLDEYQHIKLILEGMYS